MTSEAIPCTTTQTVLGEGLRWDGRRQEILGVDILTGRVYRGRVDDDGSLSLVGHYQLPATVGAIAPVHDDEGWILAAGRGFLHLSPDGSVRPIVDVTPAGTRMNDGACDPHGRFWAGTLTDDFRPGGGALYRLDTDGRVTVVRRDLTISNGLGWSPDGATMYLADSGPRVVYAFSFDVASGTLSDDRPFVTIAEEVGTPDGLTVDSDGDVWVAIYGGGQIHRYSPTGSARANGCWFPLTRAPPAPSPAPTSTGSTSPLRPRVGATSSARPNPGPGSSTASTPTPRAGPPARFALIRPGGARWRFELLRPVGAATGRCRCPA